MRLINQTLGIQVPGLVTYVGPGAPGLGTGCRIEYAASAQLANGSVFRLEVDLAVTDMTLETQQVQRLHPAEGQLGLRFVFGHGRPKGTER